MNIANNDCCIGRGLSALSSKIGSMTHLYYLMNDFRLKFAGMNSAGTTFGSITKDELFSLPIVIPTKSVISEFEQVCEPIFDKQMIIGEEINALTKQRNELLPLLMNGQATINYHLSVVNVVARLPFYRRLPIFMYCFILLLLSRLSWYNKNVRLQEMGDVVKGDMKDDMKGDMKGDMKNLSDIQKVIVSSVLDNNKMTIPELARKTGMSVSKINREIRILRDDFHVYFKMLSHSY